VYQRVWKFYFSRNFSSIVNGCKIALSNINPNIITDIADRISEIELELMKERKDKFISNVYKSRIDIKIIQQIPCLSLSKEERAKVPFTDLYWCPSCEELLTKEQALVIPCKSKADPQSYFKSKIQKLRSERSLKINAKEEDNGSSINYNGGQYFLHDLVFAEEVPLLVRERVKEEKRKRVKD